MYVLCLYSDFFFISFSYQQQQSQAQQQSAGTGAAGNQQVSQQSRLSPVSLSSYQQPQLSPRVSQVISNLHFILYFLI